MNDIEVDAIVDTDRDEVRSRIGELRRRFYRLALSADPEAKRAGSDWTVNQVVAHVLCVARRYQAVAEGRDYRRAASPRGLDPINQEEMLATLAPIPDLIDELKAVEPIMDAFFDGMPDDYRADFHDLAQASGLIFQVNWLFELVWHGEDIARAAGLPWQVSERDMSLLLLEAVELGPAYVKAGLARDTDILVALRIPAARSYVVHVHDGKVELRPRRPGDRPDAVLKTPASTMMRLILHRVGPVKATTQGLRIVGGRRPWKALKLQSCIEPV